MIMKPTLRKFALTVHLVFSVGWIGAAVAYLSLVIVAMNNQDTQTISAVWFALEIIGRYALVPLAIGSLLTGLVMSLGTKWGLFQHYWVLFSLLLTNIATVVLVSHMKTVTFYADLAAETATAAAHGLSGELLHAGVGLLILLLIQVLNVYKPRGMTPYGWRKQHEPRKVPTS
jgi:hypothetical protein